MLAVSVEDQIRKQRFRSLQQKRKKGWESQENRVRNKMCYILKKTQDLKEDQTKMQQSRECVRGHRAAGKMREWQ